MLFKKSQPPLTNLSHQAYSQMSILIAQSPENFQISIKLNYNLIVARIVKISIIHFIFTTLVTAHEIL